ncbi:MAG: YggS family pyridoxal phosphate-dependent enzyme [Cellulosilyticaceae bacterium]
MIQEQLKAIQERIEKSALKAGRNPKEITLIAVSKTYPVSAIEQAIEAGSKDFGENRVQELVDKIEQVQEDVKWHLIGHLQTNKVKYIIGKTSLIHSVDSIKLAQEIQRQSLKHDVISNILIEVNVAKEESKHGVYLEEVEALIREIANLSHVRVQGFMTVAPFVEDPEMNREVFQKLYKLSVDIQKQNIDNISTNILSMGMSNDFEVAIEEGATMVRVGTAIFGNRDYN